MKLSSLSDLADVAAMAAVIAYAILGHGLVAVGLAGLKSMQSNLREYSLSVKSSQVKVLINVAAVLIVEEAQSLSARVDVSLESLNE